MELKDYSKENCDNSFKGLLQFTLEWFKYKQNEYEISFTNKNKCFKKQWENLKISHFEKLYEHLNSSIKSSNNDFIISVENFISFLEFTERYLLFKNSNDNNIYYVYNNDIKELYFNYKEFIIKFSFEITKIKNPTNSNIALSMISGNKQIKFIQIEVLRNYAKNNVINSFKFISDEKITFNCDGDEILFDIIKRQLSDEIIKLFEEILIHSISVYTGLNTENLVWRDFINHGLWVRKY